MSTKSLYVSNVQGAATRLIQAVEDCISLRDAYFDRGYNSGQGAINDTDAAGIGVAASNISGFVNLANQLEALVTGGSTLASDWGSVLSILRGDM